MGMPRRVSRAPFWKPSIISAQSADFAFSNGLLPPPLSTLPAHENRNCYFSNESKQHPIQLYNTRMQVKRRELEKCTDEAVSDGGSGSDAALDLSHLADLLEESHPWEEVLHARFNGSVRILVHAIHGASRSRLNSCGKNQSKQQIWAHSISAENDAIFNSAWKRNLQSILFHNC